MRQFGNKALSKKKHFLIGTRWFGVLGPCELIIESLVESGYEVFVFGQEDEHYKRYYRDNCTLVKINMSRSYIAPISDIMDIVKIAYYTIRHKPTGIHSFNPKPALLAAAGAMFSPSSKFFIGITGLGNTFIRAKRMEPFIRWFLCRACGRASYVFFQNHDDIALFDEKKLVKKDKTMLFIGPGVDLRSFKPRDYTGAPPEKIRVSCVARLIWQKGIREYVAAARQMTAANPNIEFYLFGEVDHQHPDCVDPDFVKQAHDDGVITHVPWTNDIPGELKTTDIFVLHSYREGAPRAILEASATAIPTIGADAIGVRELIRDGETGYLTPLKSVEGMIEGIQKLIDAPEDRQRMGEAARRLIAEEYSLARSSQAQMEMYRNVGYDVAVAPHHFES